MEGQQLGLWDKERLGTPVQLEMRDAEVWFYADFFDRPTSQQLFEELVGGVDWRQDFIRLYDKQVALPRLTAWYGDAGKDYSYSGITMRPQGWTESLRQIKGAIEPVCGVCFNSVLLNFYRSSQDSVAWHSDDEPELGQNPVIASVSLGAARRFQFRHRQDRSLKQEVLLTDGSLLLMQGTTQHFWHHQIPKTARPIGPRINLTFRVIMT